MESIDLRTVFGKSVREKRTALGFSQEELADRADLHRTYISDVERGMRNVSLHNIEKLARALDLSIAALFGASPQAGAPVPKPGESLLEILLVEDNPNDVELTLHAFKRARVANPIHVVRDGAEALAFVFGTGQYAERNGLPQRVGLILLDLRLPKINGREVLRRLKAEPSTQSIPVVVLTVSDHDRDMAECRQLGADLYIVKPVGFRNLSEITPRLSLHWALIKPHAAGSPRLVH